MSKDNMVEEFGIGVGFLFDNFNKLKQYTDKVNNQIKQSVKVNTAVKNKAAKQEEKLEIKKQNKWEDNQKRKAEVRRKREADRLKEEANIRKGLMNRLKVYKANKAAQKKTDNQMVDATNANRIKDVKAEVARIKMITDAKYKQQFQELTQRDTIFDSMAKYYKQEDKKASEVAKNKKVLSDAEEQRRKDIQKRWNARAAERAKRLKAEIKLSEAVDNQVRIMQRSASYRDLSKKGAAGQVDSEVDRIRNTVPLREQVNEIKNLNAGLRDATRQMRAMHIVQTGLTDSARNMVRSYVSMFAILESTVAIKNVGMEFEGMEVGMSAVAGNAEKAGKEIAFLRKEADRLGFDLTKTAKSYVKLFAAAEGKASQEDIRSGFVSLMEASTVFQLTGDDTNRTIKAIMQMFSKSAIQAEELKQQLGDVLPIAMRALEKSTGKTAKELFKMMEMGQLGADRIMPFLDAIGEIANEGNAVAKAIESVRVQENRLINQSKEAGNKIFKSGFGEGLAELYKTLSDILKDAGPQLEKIGKVFGYLFKGIAHLATVVEGPLKFLIDNIEYLYGANVLLGLTALGKALRAAFLPITAAYMALEEISSLFSDKLVGTLEGSIGQQFNLGEWSTSGLKTNEKGEFLTPTSEDKSSIELDVGAILKNMLVNAPNAVSSWAEDLIKSKTGGAAQVNVTNHINGDGLNSKEVADLIDNKTMQSYALAIGR